MIVAAVWLGLLALFALLGALDVHSEGRTTDLVALAAASVVLGGTAAAVGFGGRRGYWAGITVCGLLCVPALLPVLGAPAAPGSYVLLVPLVVPLALLALPAARRRPRPRERPTPYGLPWPDGWTREGTAAWVQFGSFAGMGVVLGGAGAAAGLTSYASGPDVAVPAGFGLALAAFSVTFWPGRRGGRVAAGTAIAGGTAERGVVFP